MLEKPFTTGVSAGKTIGSERFAEVMDEYYAARGWDDNAVPTEEKLLQLDIDVRLPVDKV
jgi:aldehyde:ferredoxin oxidoreductase